MDICVWDKCNNNCLMCTNPESGWEAWDGSFDYDLKSLKNRVLKDKKRFEAGDTIYLTGGEPTIHPDFLNFFEFLVNEFPKTKIVLLTNGRRFAYKKFADDFLQISSNVDVHVSLYGHNEDIHEQITRAKGSFAQSVAGLKILTNLKKNGQKIALRHVLSSISIKHVNGFLSFVLDELPGIDKVILMFWEIEARAEKNFDHLKLKYSETKPYLKDVNHYSEKMKELCLYHFPLCQLDSECWPIAWRTWPENEIEFLAKCSKCKVKQYCVGIHKAYLKNIGEGEFEPILNDLKIKESGNEYRPIINIQ